MQNQYKVNTTSIAQTTNRKQIQHPYTTKAISMHNQYTFNTNQKITEYTQWKNAESIQK